MYEYSESKEESENVYQKVIDVATKAGCQVSRGDSVCHRVPSKSVKPG